jgi:hypothetical protein
VLSRVVEHFLPVAFSLSTASRSFIFTPFSGIVQCNLVGIDQDVSASRSVYSILGLSEEFS